MSQPTNRTRILCLAGALSLLSWNAAQAGQPRHMAPPAARAPMNRLAAGLTSLSHAAWVFLTGGLDNGCQMDPDGRCVPQEIPQSDNGCSMDPNGLPSSTSCQKSH